MTYDYICIACSKAWEEDQKITAVAIKKCPFCKKNKAQRQISSGTNFILTGGCWASDKYSK